MIDRVIDALDACESVYAVVSPHTPETAIRAQETLECTTIETPGDGYVPDLNRALSRVEPPVLTVAADLPLLDGQTVSAVLDRTTACDGSLTVCVPVERKRKLGVSADTVFEHEGRTLAPSGLNVVADATDELMIRENDRLAVNVNRPRDAQIAEALLPCE